MPRLTSPSRPSAPLRAALSASLCASLCVSLCATLCGATAWAAPTAEAPAAAPAADPAAGLFAPSAATGAEEPAAAAAAAAAAPASTPPELMAEGDAPEAEAEPEVPRDPAALRFEVLSVYRARGLDGRRLSAERSLTLKVQNAPSADAAYWRGKRLRVYRPRVVRGPMSQDVPMRQEFVGFARVDTVSGELLEARVEEDGLLVRQGDPLDSLAVMEGDLAELFREPEPPPPPPPPRRAQPKKLNPLMRKDMRWRL